MPETGREKQEACVFRCCSTTPLIIAVILFGIPGACLIYNFWPLDAMHSRSSTLVCGYGMRPTDKISCPSYYFKGQTTTQDPLILMFNGSDNPVKVCSSVCSSDLRKTSECANGYGVWILNNFATPATFNQNGCSIPPDGLFITGWIFTSIASLPCLLLFLCLVIPLCCSPKPSDATPASEVV